MVKSAHKTLIGKKNARSIIRLPIWCSKLVPNHLWAQTFALEFDNLDPKSLGRPSAYFCTLKSFDISLAFLVLSVQFHLLILEIF